MIRKLELNNMIKIQILSFAIVFSSVLLNAQSMRNLINEGVDQYNEGKYSDSEVNFKKGLSQNPESPIANFNLGDAYYKQGRFDEAVKSYQSVLTQAEDKNFKAKALHNIGNSFLKDQKYQESIEAFKNSLKLNPNDEETKYNLSYALRMMDKQNQQQQNQDQNKKNENKEQNKNDNKDEQKGNKDQDKNEQNKDQNQPQQSKPDQNQTAQQDNLKQKEEENKISKAEAERILEALKNNEKDVQKKLRKKTGVPVKTDKDW